MNYHTSSAITFSPNRIPVLIVFLLKTRRFYELGSGPGLVPAETGKKAPRVRQWGPDRVPSDRVPSDKFTAYRAPKQFIYSQKVLESAQKRKTPKNPCSGIGSL